jgi:hypothetical protein
MCWRSRRSCATSTVGRVGSTARWRAARAPRTPARPSSAAATRASAAPRAAQTTTRPTLYHVCRSEISRSAVSRGAHTTARRACDLALLIEHPPSDRRRELTWGGKEEKTFRFRSSLRVSILCMRPFGFMRIPKTVKRGVLRSCCPPSLSVHRESGHGSSVGRTSLARRPSTYFDFALWHFDFPFPIRAASSRDA